MQIATLLTVGVLLALPAAGRAQSLIYADSFENDTVNSFPAGWTASSNDGDGGYAASANTYAGTYSNFDGNQFAVVYLHGTNTTTPVDTADFFNSNVGKTFAANTTYTLTYLFASYATANTAVSLEAAGTVIPTTTENIAAQFGQTTFAAGPTLTLDTANDLALVTQNIGIDVLTTTTDTNFRSVAVDDFVLTASADVPEPGATALLGVGALALAVLARRRVHAR